VDVTWVDAKGEVHVSSKGSEEAAAMCGGLGLLGTITEFTLQLTEHSNTHFFTWYLKDDTNIAEDVERMLKVGLGLVGWVVAAAVGRVRAWPGAHHQRTRSPLTPPRRAG
jgi:FAD/FMN-containing dehydrogenase